MTHPITAHISWCRAGGVSNRTIGDREEVLRRADRDLPLGLCHALDTELRDWFANPRWSPATRETYFNHVLSFFGQSYEDGLVDDNPMLRLKRPPHAVKGEPRPLTAEELAIIFTRSVEPYRLCAVIAYGSGARCCEVAQLHREDVTEKTAYLRKTKGGKSAVVAIAPEVWETVRAFPRGPLVEHVGGVADARWISQRCAGYWSRTLKLPGASMHRLRHSFARRMRANGADPWEVKQALRHKSIATTEIYLGASAEESAARIHGLPQFLAPTPS